MADRLVVQDAIAARLDELYFDRRRARSLGEEGLERYRSLEISWETTLERLLA
jgi:hypothetical protein